MAPTTRRQRLAIALPVFLGFLGFLWWWFRGPDSWPRYDALPKFAEWSADTTHQFVVLGDTQPTWNGTGLNWHEKAAAMREVVAALQPEALVHVGDMVDTYGAWKRGHGRHLGEMWSGFLEFYDPIIRTTPFLPTVGNHDLGLGGFQKVFRMPGGDEGEGGRYWTVTHGPVRFIALDSNFATECEPDGCQARWFRRVLDQPAPRDTFVLFHHPTVTVGSSREYERTSLRDLLRPYAGQIRAIFCGHDHLYLRTLQDGIPFFVTGGGGWYLTAVVPEKAARLPQDARFGSFHHVLSVTLSPAHVRVRCIQEDGAVFDEVSLRRDG